MPTLHPEDPRTATNFRRQVPILIPNAGAGMQGYVDLWSETCETAVGIYMPAAWTAANICFQTIPPLGTPGVEAWQYVTDDAGNEYEVTVAASVYAALDLQIMSGLRYLKLVSRTAGANVPQGAARALTLVTRPI